MIFLATGDAMTLAPLRESEVIDSIVTSPPYWGLREYGDDDDEVGGHGQDLDSYLDDMSTCAKTWLARMAPTGTLWLVMGDTASGSGGAGGDYNAGGTKQGSRKWRQGESGLPKKTMCGVPHKAVDRFVAEGWILRQTVIWVKPSPARADPLHERRPLTQHEYIFLLVPEADNRRKLIYPWQLDEVPEARGSVWHLPVGRKVPHGHPAPFPDELVSRCVRLTTKPGDTVLDPFCGSGTTPQVAHQLGRRGIGIDLYRWW